MSLRTNDDDVDDDDDKTPLTLRPLTFTSFKCIYDKNKFKLMHQIGNGLARLLLTFIHAATAVLARSVVRATRERKKTLNQRVGINGVWIQIQIRIHKYKETEMVESRIETEEKKNINQKQKKARKKANHKRQSRL